MKGLYAIDRYNFHYPPLGPLQEIQPAGHTAEKPAIEQVERVEPVNPMNLLLYDRYGQKHKLKEDTGKLIDQAV
ncbi:MAG: hypothetical protein H0Z33_01210 [Bacillaceae bacterium]|nr:hypothetical protein [Bacillaceae bacterium]